MNRFQACHWGRARGCDNPTGGLCPRRGELRGVEENSGLRAAAAEVRIVRTGSGTVI